MVGPGSGPGRGAGPLTGRLVLGARGPRPPAEAWERYARPAAWSTWSPHIRRVDLASSESEPRIRPGLRGTVGTYAPARLVSAPFEVLAVDEVARTWSWVVSLGPVRVHLDHAVTSAGTGSATELVMRGPWPVIAPYAPLAALALHRLVR